MSGPDFAGLRAGNLALTFLQNAAPCLWKDHCAHRCAQLFRALPLVLFQRPSCSPFALRRTSPPRDLRGCCEAAAGLRCAPEALEAAARLRMLREVPEVLLRAAGRAACCRLTQAVLAALPPRAIGGKGRRMQLRGQRSKRARRLRSRR